MPSAPGHIPGPSLTNGHNSALTINPTPAGDDSPHSESDLSEVKENGAEAGSSDEDAPGEEFNEEDEMEIDSDSSEDADAEGEPDGDYDSETPPPEQDKGSRARSSASEDSTRPPKRKAGRSSAEKDDYIEQNPELYGLRRSVCLAHPSSLSHLIVLQGRARPNRRIVRAPSHTLKACTHLFRSMTPMIPMGFQSQTRLVNANVQPHAKVCHRPPPLSI
jgi:chromodomain-helicase-DNA-binding protein 1